MIGRIVLMNSRRYRLHVPIVVLLFGALMKQVNRSDTLRGD
jgi:hypothetical protein